MRHQVPNLSTLRSAIWTGRLDPDLVKLIETKPHCVDQFSSPLAFAFWPESQHDELEDFFGFRRAHTGADKRIRAPKFRERLLQIYQDSYAFCEFEAQIGSVSVALEGLISTSFKTGDQMISTMESSFALFTTKLSTGAPCP